MIIEHGMTMKILGLFFYVLITIFSEQVFAGEKDVYEFTWLDPDKEVYVLQNRKFKKSNMFHLNAGFGITTSGAFVDSTSMQARAGYFFTEDWGFELLYSKNSGEENDTAKSIRSTSAISSGQTPFRRIVQSYYGVMGLWSPFYTKINTFNKIAYMDWIFGLGYGNLTEKNNKFAFDSNAFNRTKVSEESHGGLLWTAAMKFYLNEHWSIRGDFTGVYYGATEPVLNKKQNINHYDATLSLGFGF